MSRPTNASAAAWSASGRSAKSAREIGGDLGREDQVGAYRRLDHLGFLFLRAEREALHVFRRMMAAELLQQLLGGLEAQVGSA
jgi:hypothetical protein